MYKLYSTGIFCVFFIGFLSLCSKDESSAYLKLKLNQENTNSNEFKKAKGMGKKTGFIIYFIDAFHFVHFLPAKYSSAIQAV